MALWVANKDGGAHVDDRLPAEYEAIISGLGMSLCLYEDDSEKIPDDQRVKTPLENLHFATLRQIAYETIESPDLKALATMP
jgi:hypothetical protein